MSVCKALHESICEHPVMSGLRQGPLGAFLATQFMVAGKEPARARRAAGLKLLS